MSLIAGVAVTIARNPAAKNAAFAPLCFPAGDSIASQPRLSTRPTRRPSPQSWGGCVSERSQLRFVPWLKPKDIVAGGRE